MHSIRQRLVATVAGLMSAVALATGAGSPADAHPPGGNSGSGHWGSGHWGRAGSVTLAEQRCDSLVDLTVDRRQIGLPTSGAYLESATWTTSGETAYCQVTGWIRPVHQGSPSMQFEVNLPAEWNRRTLQMGGGGYDGTLVTGLDAYTAQPSGEATPLQQGYVTLGSDGGHQGGPGFDGTFGLDDEALLNYGKESVKKTHDAAAVVVRAAYHRNPAYSYFIGGSQGGHEALDAAARYPKDYDGVIANYPAYNVTMMHEGAVNFRDALYGDGGAGWLSPAKTKLITDAVYAACDGLDGADDDIVSNVRGCDRVFDPDTLRCPSGTDEGDTCLSDAQLAAAKKIATDYDLGFPVAGNRTFARSALFEGALYQGFSGFGARPQPSNPIAGDEALQYIVLDQTSKYIVTRDPSLDTMSFDPRQWRQRIQQVATIMDVTDVSLEPFLRRGGKIILTHGTADDFITPHNTIQYYERQLRQFGPRLRSFLRFYEIPGFGHGQGPFDATYDGLEALQGWVEHGRAPRNLVAYDGNQGAHRSRPLCEYPAWPSYVGGGSIDDASSYRCVGG
ncbi:tannase/feruloyl esterase family alpha/beta hydrolase [Nocardioides cheoyonin]|uniref:tannase/feruloyl esterase family alpha/beta hydrolase n=1 Tax=Nocardioides cheoyonin TaxID=3156615 RepID=UPI0032B5731C